MTARLRLVMAAWALQVVGLPALAADPPAIVTDYDVVYSRPDGVDLKLDIARPAEAEGPTPIVFVIHGGAWRAGNKEQMRPAMGEFARRGYVAVSPQYRFCPKVVFPAQVHDVKAAVRWMKTHANDYKADPEKVGAIGFSAGGHLSLMLGVTGPDDGLEGDHASDSPSTKIQAVVNYFGPSDLAAADIPNASKPLVSDFLGGIEAERPQTAAKASPLTYVTKDDPPILTFQGTKDPLVPHSQAIKLAEAMNSAGVAGRVELLIGAGHGWGGNDLQQTRAESFTFFDRYLKSTPPPKN